AGARQRNVGPDGKKIVAVAGDGAGTLLARGRCVDDRRQRPFRAGRDGGECCERKKSNDEDVRETKHTGDSTGLSAEPFAPIRRRLTMRIDSPSVFCDARLCDDVNPYVGIGGTADLPLRW